MTALDKIKGEETMKPLKRIFSSDDLSAAPVKTELGTVRE